VIAPEALPEIADIANGDAEGVIGGETVARHALAVAGGAVAAKPGEDGIDVGFGLRSASFHGTRKEWGNVQRPTSNVQH
jgi:hypothetical protein